MVTLIYVDRLSSVFMIDFLSTILKIAVGQLRQKKYGDTSRQMLNYLLDFIRGVLLRNEYI